MSSLQPSGFPAYLLWSGMGKCKASETLAEKARDPLVGLGPQVVPCRAISSSTIQTPVYTSQNPRLALCLTDNFSIDDNANTVRRVLERIAIVEREVSVLSHCERTNSIVNTKNASRIDRYRA